MLVKLGNGRPAYRAENGYPPAGFASDGAATGFRVKVAVSDGKEFTQLDTAVQQQSYDCQVPRPGKTFKPLRLVQKPK